MKKGIHMKSKLGFLLPATLFLFMIATTPGFAWDKTSKDRAACERGNLESCGVLGMALSPEEREVDETLVKVTQRAMAGCMRNVAKSCLQAGLLVSGGMGAKKDEEQSANYIKLACKLGDVEGCNTLGFFLERGIGMPKDNERAFKQYKEACEKGFGDGCYLLARAHVKGLVGKKDIRGAEPYYVFACEKGVAGACEELGYLLLRGDAIGRDMNRSLATYERGCSKGNPNACAIAGGIHAGEWDAHFDKAKALSYSKKACGMGQQSGCERQARVTTSGYSSPHARFLKTCHDECDKRARTKPELENASDAQVEDVCQITCTCMESALVPHPDFPGFHSEQAIASVTRKEEVMANSKQCIEEQMVKLNGTIFGAPE